MKLLSKKSSIADFIMFIVMSAGLFLLYFLFKRLGFSEGESKGISLLFLLVILAVYLFSIRAMAKLRWERRFKGLSTEQAIIEMEKVFEESVSEGIITREELEGFKKQAETKYENKKFNIGIDQ